ncbi:MAG: response regulator [Deltaproteobacteria bacterium]|jgi:signal transduction histidine kinase/DNA-binding NarL/FixJ family response regulator/HPt (histidine-containing phosphotransfer) domain-containing protein|nr:response regulator [Deltaproteobacteria bacterium]
MIGRLKNDYKLIVLVLVAFLIMTLASYLFVSRVLRRQIDLYSTAEMQVYRNSILSQNRACEDALLHAAMVMSIALDRGVGPYGHLDLIKRLTAAFSTQGNLRPIFNAAFCYLDGNFVSVDDVSPVPETALHALEWYRGVTERPPVPAGAEAHVYHTDVYLAENSSSPVVAMSRPIIDSAGRERGVMAMEFLIAPVVEKVASLQPETAGFVPLLADSSMRLLYYPDPERIGDYFYDLSGFAPLVERMPDDPDELVIERFEIEGEKCVGIFSRLENGWLLGTISPVAYYYGEAVRTFPVILAIALVSAATLSIVLLRLSWARDRSEKANRLKTHSLARISHELRTPLNTIIGLSELARRDPKGSSIPAHLDEIAGAGGTLLSLVNEILDFSKMESGKIDISEEPYRLGRLLTDVLASISVRLKEKPHLEFRSNVAKSLPRSLLGDEHSVKQVILNLLVNAVKYTQRGFVSFSADFESIDESLILLKFTVGDSGVGIKQEDLEHLFDDFVRLDDKGSNRQIEGTGLGLSIAQTLCRLMGGDVSVESQFGRGSVFTATCRQVVLDPRPIGDFSLRPAEIRPPEEAVFAAPGFKVLVVDDVATNLVVAKGLMEPFEMEVAVCQSGLEALKLAAEERFDLFFIDQMMPEMDGVETLHGLRSLGGSCLSAPIISLTANAVAGARESLLDQGFDDYMSKPIEMGDLNSLMDKWVPHDRRRPKSSSRSADGTLDENLEGSSAGTLEGASDGATEKAVQSSSRVASSGGIEPGSDEANFLAALSADGFEPQIGLRRSGGSLKKYQEVLRAFLFDADALARKLVLRGGPEELAELTSVAHALKSATANIGLVDLSGRAAALEKAGQAGDAGPFRNGELESFRRDFSKAADLIRRSLSFSEAGEIRDQPARKLDGGLLDALLSALQVNDVVQADRLIEELSEASDGETKASLMAASDQILMAEYSKAQDIIRQLR